MAAPRGKFCASAAAASLAKKPRLTIPKAADVNTQIGCMIHDVPMPTICYTRLGTPSRVIGFDIETHGWDDGDKQNKGRMVMDWYTTCSEDLLNYARIVQLGWAFGACGCEPVVKQRTVKPSGFEIQSKATRVHGITQSAATQNGADLKDVLTEFMDDVIETVRADGTAVAHHIIFDAGIILRELERCGLNQLATAWQSIVRSGFDTMAPEVAIWVLQSCGKAYKETETAKTNMKLPEMHYALLGPASGQAMQLHTAGNDARMTREIAVSLVSRVRAREHKENNLKKNVTASRPLAITMARSS